MGTRSGDLDPAIVGVHCAERRNVVHQKWTRCSIRNPDCWACPGLTNDMRELQAELKEHDDRRVRLAIEIFCYRARKYIGAYLAAMGGADAVVFTGGIGENSPDVRAQNLRRDGMGRVSRSTTHRISKRSDVKERSRSRIRSCWLCDSNGRGTLIARDTVRVIKGEPHPS